MFSLYYCLCGKDSGNSEGHKEATEKATYTALVLVMITMVFVAADDPEWQIPA